MGADPEPPKTEEPESDEIDSGPDMAGLESMMGGMGGLGGEGGAGGMDMSALMSMLGKGGGKGGDMGGMGGMMGKGGGKGEANESEQAGKDGKWHWQQKGEEIQVRIPLDPPATKKDISVKFKSASLAVTVRGETVLDGNLCGKVEVDECTWCLTPAKDELQVMLTKVAGKTDSWPSLIA